MAFRFDPTTGDVWVERDMAEWVDIRVNVQGNVLGVVINHRERAVEHLRANFRNMSITPVDEEGRRMYDAAITFPEGTLSYRVDDSILEEAGVQVEELPSIRGNPRRFGLREIQSDIDEVARRREMIGGSIEPTSELSEFIRRLSDAPILHTTQQPRHAAKIPVNPNGERLITVEHGPDAGTTEYWVGKALYSLTVDGVYYTRNLMEWGEGGAEGMEQRSYGYTQCRPLFELMPIDEYDAEAIDQGVSQECVNEIIRDVNSGNIEPMMDCPWHANGGIHWGGITPEWGIPRPASMLDLSDDEVDSLPMSVLERYV